MPRFTITYTPASADAAKISVIVDTSSIWTALDDAAYHKAGKVIGGVVRVEVKHTGDDQPVTGEPSV